MPIVGFKEERGTLPIVGFKEERGTVVLVLPLRMGFTAEGGEAADWGRVCARPPEPRWIRL